MDNIKLCNLCNGEGRPYRVAYESCNLCNGTGRIRSVKYAFDFPYDPTKSDDALFNELDTKVHEMYRNLHVILKSDEHLREIEINKLIDN